MPAEQPVIRHESDTEHDVWVKCFLAAIAGQAMRSAPALQVALDAAAIADAALEQERARRWERARH